jgi:hypothetical protein
MKFKKKKTDYDYGIISNFHFFPSGSLYNEIHTSEAAAGRRTKIPLPNQKSPRRGQNPFRDALDSNISRNSNLRWYIQKFPD